MEKYRVTLAPEERAALEQLVSRGKSASRKLTHACILLLADVAREEGYADDEIVAALGTSLKTIARVLRRFVVEGLEAAVDHRQQPARPDNRSLIAEEVAAWEIPRNARKVRIHWTFTLAVARQKLRKLYPSIAD
jgi:transposase